MPTITEVRVPDIGDFDNVPIIEIMVAPGDSVAAEDSLITLESDKAAMDVPAPESGIIKDLQVAIGDEVSEGTLILTLEVSDGSAAAAPPEPEQAQAAPQTDVALVEVQVPDIGDFSDVPVIEVMVAPGDSLSTDDPVITLESDKAAMDVPAPGPGTVKEIRVAVGDQLSQGDVILVMESVADVATMSVSADPPPEPEPAPAPSAAAPPITETPPAPGGDRAGATPDPRAPAYRPAPIVPEDSGRAEEKKSHATPSVRLFARDLGVDLTRVTGTGRKGRILKDDVQRFVKGALSKPESAPGGGALPEMPAVDFSKFGEIEIRPLSRIKKLSGKNLHRAWLVVPHVTQHDEADVTELEAFRKSEGEAAKKRGVRLTALAFILKASANALRAHPSFNASLDPSGENIILKRYCNIGVAVDTPDGLVVPVFRDVDRKGIEELALELGEMSGKARDKKLMPGDMQGGCFTISSLGGIGGTAFTPIVNAPEVAILGVSRSSMKPVYLDGEFVPRLMLPVSLSYDHRVIDGAAAARFTRYLCDLLADIRKLLL